MPRDANSLLSDAGWEAEELSRASSDLDAAVKGKFQVKDIFQLPDDEVEYKVVYAKSSKARFKELRDQLEKLGFVPWLFGTPNDATLLVRKRQVSKGGASRVPVLLLLLTLTSIVVFALLEDYLYTQLAPQLSQYVVALSYAASVVAILAAYQFGHRFASERAGMPPSTPYFIPGVPFYVTAYTPALGIVSSQRGPALNRDSVFNVSLAGPLAAFAVALVLMVVGEFAWVQSAVTIQGGQFSNSIISVNQLNPSVMQVLVDSATSSFSRSVPLGFAKLSPIGDAAYAGFLIYFLNILPIVRLDGGNMFSAALGERGIRSAAYLSVLALIIIDAPTYWAIAIFVLLVAGRPGSLQVLDEVSPPSNRKKFIMLGAILLAFLCLPLPQNLAFLPLG